MVAGGGELVVWKTLSFPPGTRGEGGRAVRRRGEGPGPAWGEGLASGEYVSWRSDICLQAEGSTVNE